MNPQPEEIGGWFIHDSRLITWTATRWAGRNFDWKAQDHGPVFGYWNFPEHTDLVRQEQPN